MASGFESKDFNLARALNPSDNSPAAAFNEVYGDLRTGTAAALFRDKPSTAGAYVPSLELHDDNAPHRGGIGAVLNDLYDGAVKRIENDGWAVVGEAALGAGVTIGLAAVATTAAGPYVLGAAALGSGLYTGWEIGEHHQKWLHDLEVVYNPEGHTIKELKAAHDGVRGLGAGSVDIAAGVGGSLVGGVVADAAAPMIKGAVSSMVDAVNPAADTAVSVNPAAVNAGDAALSVKPPAEVNVETGANAGIDSVAGKPAVYYQANDTNSPLGVLKVQRIDHPVTIETPQGAITGGQGDVLITTGEGSHFIAPENQFTQNFTPVPADLDTPLLTYKKIVPVHAEQLTEPFAWKDSNGGDLLGNAGDWKLTIGDKVSTITPDKFAATYEASGQPGIYFKAAPTRAQLITKPIQVPTLEGMSTGNIGDYLATGVSGEQYVIGKDAMASLFRLSGGQ